MDDWRDEYPGEYINYEKHPNKRYNLHTVNETGKAAKPVSSKRYKKKCDDADVCLNCTREKCSGSDECFRKEMKKRNG